MSKTIRLMGLMILGVALVLIIGVYSGAKAADETVNGKLKLLYNGNDTGTALYDDANLHITTDDKMYLDTGSGLNNSTDYGIFMKAYTGYNRIYDDGQLHIATDDFMFLDAPQKVYFQNEAYFKRNYDGNTNSGSRIYDDAQMHIATDDNLFLDAPTLTTVQGGLTVGGLATLNGVTNLVGGFQIGGVAVTSSAAELNIMDGVTATAAELNIMDGVTATAAELNVLDGITSTVAELNILDGVTSTAAELNLLDGVTATTAELNFIDGVTSAIQTQIDAKSATGHTHLLAAGATDVTSTAAELNVLDGVTSTAAELNVLDGITASVTELNYTDGVTSAIQTQLDAKADIAAAENISGVWEVQDNIALNFGNDADIGILYDEAADDRLEITGNVWFGNNVTIAGTFAPALTTATNFDIGGGYGDTGVSITAAGAINANAGITSDTTVQAEQLTSTDDLTVNDTALIDATLTLATGSITDSTGAISFGNENLTTTGTGTFTTSLTVNATGGGVGGYVDFGGGTVPGNAAGRVYYNTVDGNIYVYDGVAAAWVDLTQTPGALATLDDAYNNSGAALVVVDGNGVATQGLTFRSTLDGANEHDITMNLDGSGDFFITDADDSVIFEVRDDNTAYFNGNISLGSEAGDSINMNGSINTNVVFQAAGGERSITGPSDNTFLVQAGAARALNLTSNAASTYQTTVGGLTLIGETTVALTAEAGAVNITSTGAGNDIVLNSADTIELQDNVNATAGLDVTGAVLTTAVGSTNTAGEVLISGGNMQINDAIVLTIGTGDDMAISWTDGTQNFLVDNTSATGSTIFQLGTDTAATDFQIQNNTGTPQFTLTGAGVATFAGNVDANGGLDITGNLVVTGTSDLRGNVSDSLGDFTIDDTLAVTGQADFAANVDANLGLDVIGADFTVGGGYGATGVTITDAGAISANGAIISGSTITINGNVGTDSIVSDRGLTVQAAAGSLTLDVDGAGSDILMTPADDVTVTFAAGGQMVLDADTTDATVDTLSIDVGTLTNGVDGVNINVNVAGDTGNDADIMTGLNVTVANNATDQATDDNIYGILINDLGGANNSGNEYGMYILGAGWDYGLYVLDDSRFDSVLDLNGSMDADVTTFNVAATQGDINAIVLDAATFSGGVGGLNIDAGTSGIDMYTTGNIKLDTDANSTVDVDTGFDLDVGDAQTVTFTTTTGDSANYSFVLIEDTAADVTQQTWLQTLRYTDDGDVDADFLRMQDAAGANKVAFEQGGDTTWTLDPTAELNVDIATNDFAAATTIDGIDYGAIIAANTGFATNFDGMDMALTANDEGVIRGIVITANDGAESVDAAIAIVANDPDVADLMTDGVLFTVAAGGLTDAIDASDGDIVNALNVGDNVILGAAASIDFTEFDVSGTTGSVTINDGGDLGQVSIEGTILDINSLDFVGVGAVTSTGAALAITGGTTVDISSTGANDINLTTGNAANLVEIITGNLKVGNGANGVALNGEDAYIEGTLEVDGGVQLDGAVVFNGVATFNTDVDMVFAGTENLAVTNTTGDAAVDLISVVLTNTDSTAAAQRMLVLQNASNAAVSITESLLAIDNADADAVTDGILFSATGAITDAIDASAAAIVNALNVGDNVILGVAASIDFTEFDVSGTTGSVTINDGGDLGQVSIEGTILDINSLDFVGVGTLTTAANGALTMTAGGTGDFGVSIDADSVATFTASAGPGVDMVTITNAGQATTDVAGLDALAVNFTTGNGTDRTHSAINVALTSGGTVATDLANGLLIDLAATAGGTDTAIKIQNTAGWDVDIDLQNEETIVNTTDDLIVLTGVGGTNNTSLTIDLDGVAGTVPTLIGGVSDVIAINDGLSIGVDGTIATAISYPGFALAAGNDLYIADMLGVNGNSFFDGTLSVLGVGTADGAWTYNTDVDFTLAGTENIAITNTTGSNAVDILTMTITNDDAGAAAQRGLVISNAAASTSAVEALIVLDNADAVATTDGILIDATGAGGITDAIDVSAANIVNALNIGANTILGTTGAINLDKFDVTGAGAVALTTDAANVSLTITGAATNTTNLVDINHQNVEGSLIDIDYSAATTLNVAGVVGVDINLSTNVTTTNNPALSAFKATMSDGGSGLSVGLEIDGSPDRMIDLSGASTGTTDIMFQNAETLDNNTDGQFTFSTGNIVLDGNVTPNGNNDDLGSTAAEWDDIFVGDANGLNFGLDQDAELAYDEAGDDRVELTGTGASLYIEDRLSLGRQTLTMVTGGAATENLTPTASYVEVTGQDNALDVVQIQTASAKEGDLLIITNLDATNVSIDQTATTKLDGGVDVLIGQYDVIMLIFDGTNWLQVAKVTPNS